MHTLTICILIFAMGDSFRVHLPQSEWCFDADTEMTPDAIWNGISRAARPEGLWANGDIDAQQRRLTVYLTPFFEEDDGASP